MNIWKTYIRNEYNQRCSKSVLPAVTLLNKNAWIPWEHHSIHFKRLHYLKKNIHEKIFVVRSMFGVCVFVCVCVGGGGTTLWLLDSKKQSNLLQYHVEHNWIVVQLFQKDRDAYVLFYSFYSACIVLQWSYATCASNRRHLII